MALVACDILDESIDDILSTPLSAPETEFCFFKRKITGDEGLSRKKNATIERGYSYSCIIPLIDYHIVRYSIGGDVSNDVAAEPRSPF